jgi:hypothetical protein
MKSLLFFFILVLISGNAAGQEVQVVFDSAKTIQVIDQDLEKKLNLFPHYPHFLEARLFKEPDSSFIVEITSFENGQLIHDRIPKTALDVRAIREDVDERMGSGTIKSTLDQSSRSKFMVWETLLSVFCYGPAVVAGISPDNGGEGAGLELIIGGLGYLLSSVLTENAPMTDGESSLALGGAFLGAGHGILIDEVLSNGNTDRELAPFGALVSVAETGIGYAIASKNNMTEGTADIIRYGGLFGMYDGAGLALVVNNSPSTSLWTGMSLAGSAAGFALGSVMANNQTYTRGNASAVLTAGIYGTFIPAAIYASAISWNSNTNPTTALALMGVAGNVGSIILANSLMSDRHFSTAEGTSVILGTTAGFLIGLGVAYIITSGNQVSVTPWEFTLPMVIGSAAGFGITLATIGKGTGDRSSTGWNFDANPGALMGALLPQHSNAAPIVSPILSASRHF